MSLHFKTSALARALLSLWLGCGFLASPPVAAFASSGSSWGRVSLESGSVTDLKGASASPTHPIAQASAMDGRTFYEVLLGEMEWRAGRSGSAYELIFESAQRNKDETLFRRSAEIAIQARAGEQALDAVEAWRQAQPDSVEALRFQVQLLFALNRQAQAIEPLSALLRITPAADRASLIQALPAFFARYGDRVQSAHRIEQVLLPYAQLVETRFAVHLALARAWLAAKDGSKALAHIQQAQQEKPQDVASIVLALELVSTDPAAEALVTRFLRTHPEQYRLRLSYVRTLTQVERYADAAAELQALTAQAPRLRSAWLALGAVQLALCRPQRL
jgi:predicted Zn-dependent protease